MMNIDWQVAALAVAINLIWSVALIVVVRKICRPEVVYLVGRIRAGFGSGIVWDVIGVFSHQEKASAACRERDDFYFPVSLDKKKEDPERAPLAFPVREGKG